MTRSLFNDDHEAFRATVRAFYAEWVIAEYAEWQPAVAVPRRFWTAAGKRGLLGMQVPEEFGGGGQDSFLFNAILTEESRHAGIALEGLRIQTDIVVPYFLHVANAQQRSRWLPGLVSGDTVSALTVSETGAGSDMKAITTRAAPYGDSYIIYGSNTFISNGLEPDLIVTFVQTNPGAGRDGLSLLVVDGDSPRLKRGRELEQLGLTELIFDDVVVPRGNILGDEGKGCAYLTEILVQESLSIAVSSHAGAVKMLEDANRHAQSSNAFDATAASFHGAKFDFASCAAEIEEAQSLLDGGLIAHEGGELSASDAAAVKLHCTELQVRVIDRCLQLQA